MDHPLRTPLAPTAHTSPLLSRPLSSPLDPHSPSLYIELPGRRYPPDRSNFYERGCPMALQISTGDEDRVVSDWLLHGALGGLASLSPKGPYFPATSDPPGSSISDVLAAERNHPSFDDLLGEASSPGRRQALDTAKRGFARRFPNRAAAEDVYGPMLPAPLGNI